MIKTTNFNPISDLKIDGTERQILSVMAIPPLALLPYIKYLSKANLWASIMDDAD